VTEAHPKHRAKRLGWKIERPHWDAGRRLLVGIDEAGRGPLAGPVVAAAISLPYELCQKLPKNLRAVNDSKQLNEETREALFEAITSLGVPYGVGIVSNEVIDEINILQATMRAMTIAVESLVAQTSSSPEMLLIDGNYFRTTLSYPFQTVIEGDAKSPHIAAASILAKVTRDRIMRELHVQYPDYNFAQHKGYATQQHRDAIALYGVTPVHRLSFGPTAIKHWELFEEIELSTLD
jgi:ribonuclease HII